MPDTIVIGAGMAGLVAAAELVDAGQDVVVLDKGRGPGGRMATRRVDAPRGTAVVDHGAQFFTVRSPVFADLIRSWPIHVWHHGPATARSIHEPPRVASPGGDGHPRYVGDDGMAGVAKHLARGVDVRVGVRVQAVTPAGGGWQVSTEHGLVLGAPRVLVTCPVPQAVELLPDGIVDAAVADIGYEPCLALLAVLDVPPDDLVAVQFDDGPVRFLADNASKGISSLPAVTVHAHGAWSAEHYDEDDRRIGDDLWALVAPWVAPGRAEARQVKRWRYATPTDPHRDRAVMVGDGLVLAGDAFGGPKVEGAVLSGLAAAERLGDRDPDAPAARWP